LAIVKALQDDKTANTYSLRAPFLIPIIEHYEKLIDSQNKDFSKTIDRSLNKKHKTNISKTKNILSILEDIDNES
jgi:hypothetical protein